MERLTADHYFRAAVVVLGEQGSESLTIAALCDRLGVTKGSFYHHFGGMPGFVTAFLAYWEATVRDELASVSDLEPDPARQVLAMVDLAVDLPHAAEAALRAWARSNQEVAEAQTRVDAGRESCLTDTFLDLGLTAARAHLFTRLSVHMLVGAQLRDPHDPQMLRDMFGEIFQMILLEIAATS